MSDIEMNDMGMEEQVVFLGQMVTEALLRDSQAAPDASSEWQKLAARMNANSKKPLRPLWIAISAAAAIALVVVLLHVRGIHEDKSSIYQAKAEPTDIVILDEEENERVVKGNELTLAQTQEVENHMVVVPGKDQADPCPWYAGVAECQ